MEIYLLIELHLLKNKPQNKGYQNDLCSNETTEMFTVKLLIGYKSDNEGDMSSNKVKIVL
jgi:hypothetical protein